MSESERRMLKIKTGSVNRLKKELGLYVEEKEKERQKVARMKEEAADTYDIKHAENVLEESTLMIPDTRQRLEGALQDLTNYVGGVEAHVTATEELKAAQEAIEAAQTVLQ